MSHTPGPWFDWENGIWNYDLNKLSGKLENARLIAVSPELLEALKMCVIERSGWLKAAKKVISRATGEESEMKVMSNFDAWWEQHGEDRDFVSESFERFWAQEYEGLQNSNSPKALIEGFKEVSKKSFVCGYRACEFNK